MPTTPYSDSMKAMVTGSPDMATEMFEDAINALFAGELNEGRLLLRQYVNATIGFGELARRTGKADKNLIRTLGPNGSPTAANLFQIIRACMTAEGVTVSAHVTRPGAFSRAKQARG